MRLLRNAALAGLATLLFLNISCSSAPPPVPQSTPTASVSRQVQTTKPYLRNLTDYKEISPDEWLTYYPAGLTVPTDSEIYRKLEGKTLTPERVMVGNYGGLPKEYVVFRDADNNEYFATISALSGMTEDVESSAEVDKIIEANKPDIFSLVMISVEDNKNPNPEIGKIMGSNPYVIGRASHSVLKDVEVIDFKTGEVTPFVDYAWRLNSGKMEFEFSGVPESALTYLLMDRLGVNYTIPFVERKLGTIIGDKIIEGKVYETPAATKVNVKVSYQPGSNFTNVSGSAGDSVLTRVTRYTYFSIKAGKSLEAEDVPPPLKEYKLDAEVDTKETLRAIGEYIAEKNREEDIRQEQKRRETQKSIETVVPQIQKKLEETKRKTGESVQEKAQQAEELKKKFEEELRKKNEEIKRQEEERERKSRENLQKAKEKVEDVSEAVCDNWPKFIPKPEACK